MLKKYICKFNKPKMGEDVEDVDDGSDDDEGGDEDDEAVDSDLD